MAPESSTRRTAAISARIVDEFIDGLNGFY